jgi:hypothetical protein
LFRFLAKLAVKVGLIVRIHPAFEDRGINGPIKEPGGDAQRSSAPRMASCQRSSGAWSEAPSRPTHDHCRRFDLRIPGIDFGQAKGTGTSGLAR